MSSLPLHYSDGTGTVPEIAARRAASGVDEVLLTDHDTLAAKDSGEEGGRLDRAAGGFEGSPRRRQPLPRVWPGRGRSSAVTSRRRRSGTRAAGGGFGFLAHPFSHGSERFKRRARGCRATRSTRRDTGIEVWSFVTDSAERVPSLRALLAVHDRAASRGRPSAAGEPRGVGPDVRGAARAALGGVDAHQVGIRVAGRVPLRLKPYKRSFRYLRTHLLVSEPLTGDVDADRAAVFGVLESGHAYIAVDSVAPARGFRFWAEGDGQVGMGDEAPAGAWTLRVQVPLVARLRLLQDGNQVASGEGLTLEHPAEGPGVYRVEAYRDAHGRERTWILSNPIYLR